MVANDVAVLGKEPNDVEVAVSNETGVRICGAPYTTNIQPGFRGINPIELAKLRKLVSTIFPVPAVIAKMFE